jgi:hypothetical protein
VLDAPKTFWGRAVTLAVRFFGQTVGQKYDCARAPLDFDDFELSGIRVTF